ncbi:MAG: response regulator [Acidobacteriota bacterium]
MKPLVLIVDDAPTSAIALELACSGIPGVDVTAVCSALDAVRILQAADSRVCAVVTDLKMPVMDGFELIEFIRARPANAGLPIVVVTADSEPETSGRVKALGANAVFPKPFSPGAVRETLERLLYANQRAN